MYNVMANVITIVGILSLLINNYSLALQVGAFNTGVYGKTKSSKPEVVSMIREVFNIYIRHVNIILHDYHAMM